MRAGAEILARLREHPRHAALLLIVLALLAGAWAPPALAVLAAAALFMLQPRAAGLAAAVAVLAAGAVADARRAAVDNGRVPARPAEAVRAELELLEPLRRRASGVRAGRARVVGGWATGEQVLLRVRPDANAGLLDAGDRIVASGRMARLGPYERIHRRRGALAALDAAVLRPTGRRGGAMGFLDGIRRRAETALADGSPPARAALLHGMVLGRDHAVEEEVREAFERSGLAHLLAASGTNVMLLVGLVLWAGALAGAPLRLRLVLAGLTVVIYVPVAGGGASILRAGVMGTAALVAIAAGRRTARWYALALAAAVTLLLNPYAAAEPGWQLSFAAVAGLLAWTEPLRQRLREVRGARGWTGSVGAAGADVTAVSAAATLATAPILALHFGEVSLVSLPANLVAAPAVAPVMWLGTVAGVMAQVGVATPLGAVAGWGAAYVGAVARAASAVPGAAVEVAGGAAAALTILLAAIALSWRRRRRVHALARRAWTGNPVAVAASATAVVVLVALSLLPAGRLEIRSGETVISFLDIGQGDATLVQRRETAVLFDTGPPGGPVIRRLHEAGVDRLDALVLTHAQTDHEGEALEVVRRFRPRLVVNGGAGWPSRVQAGLPRAAARTGARVARLAAGERLRVGSLEIAFLWPPRALLEAPPEGDPNDRALVAHLRAGHFSLLLPADAESNVTGVLDLPRVDALKVAHHGSADEGLPALLERLRPTVAAIEVGRGNRYGHPAPSTLAALRGVPRVHRTDRDGTVRLRVRGRAMAVHRSGWR